MSRLDAPPRGWQHGPTPPRKARCYRSKSEALRVFADRNRALIDRWGGLSIKASPAEFDAINLKYDLRGKRAARTIEQSLFAALPSPCLDQIDLVALNATSPASETPFELPDHVIDAVGQRAERKRHAEERERRRRERAEPFDLFGRPRRRRRDSTGVALAAMTIAGIGLAVLAATGR